ncbi:hypothetical protein FKM82_026536 [Ascaphus truei]
MSVKKPLDPRSEPFSSGVSGVCLQVLDWQTPGIGSAAWQSAHPVLPVVFHLSPLAPGPAPALTVPAVWSAPALSVPAVWSARTETLSKFLPFLCVCGPLTAGAF